MSINYEKTEGGWSGVQAMTLTGFKDAGKVIYGFEMDINPNTSLKTLQFVNHDDYYGASNWGNSNDHVYHGSTTWTDLPATTNAYGVYLVGSFNSWKNADEDYALTKVDGNHWKGTFELDGASSNYDFKVYALDDATGWGYQFSGNGYWFNSTNTKVTQLWSNNNNDQIVPMSESGKFVITVEYFGDYDNHGQLTINQYKSVDIDITAAGYATYYNSAVAYVMPANMEGYVWNNGLVKAYDAEAVVPAGTALVLKAAQGKYTLNFTTGGTAPAANALLGTDEETDLTEDASSYFYGLSLNAAGDVNSVGFYWMKEGGAAFTNGAHKAYLKLAKTSGAKAGYAFNDSDVDAINAVQATLDVNAPIYNIAGQRVTSTGSATGYKGILIQNGRKFINK